MVAGGGATDFCIGHTDCATYDKHWPYRILVAGGGGGGSAYTLDGSSPNADTTYKHGTGGSAKRQGKGENGLKEGKEFNSGNSPYAPAGFDSVPNYPFSQTYIDQYTSLFGKGMNASDAPGSDPVYRSGGGGGGWYGGFFTDSYKDNGGGAGSSYAFTGDNQGLNGKQNESYKITNISGENGGTTCNIFQIKKDSSGQYNLTREITSGKMLGVGDGQAWIEVLDN